MDIPKWLADREAACKNRYKTLEVGENRIEIDLTQAPKSEPSKFGAKTDVRAVYFLVTDEEENELSVGKGLERLIVKALMQEINPMTIVRVGSDINTAYSIKELES